MPRYMLSLAFFCFFAIRFTPVLSAYEYIEEKDRVIKGVIAAVRDDYISLTQSEGNRSSETETAFFRRREIDLVNVDHWHQLKEGGIATINYIETSSVHENRNEKGKVLRDSKVLSRDIRSIEVPVLAAKGEKKINKPPGMLKSVPES